MSEPQPRRRRDRKKRKAQLAKEEWDEGKALYDVEPEDEDEVVEPTPEVESSNSDDDDPHENPDRDEPTSYKTVLFILLVLLGAIAGFVLLDNNTGDEVIGASKQSSHVQEPLPMPVPAVSEDSLEETEEAEIDFNGIPIPERHEESRYFESVGGFIDDLLEEIRDNEDGAERVSQTESAVSAEDVSEEVPENKRNQNENPGIVNDAGQTTTEIPALMQTQIEDPLVGDQVVLTEQLPTELDSHAAEVPSNDPIPTVDDTGKEGIVQGIAEVTPAPASDGTSQKTSEAVGVEHELLTDTLP